MNRIVIINSSMRIPYRCSRP